MNIDFWNLLYTHLEEQRYDSIYQNADYLKFSQQVQKFSNQYDNLDLSDEQRKIINHWIDAIHAQDEVYTAVVFRMVMQCCFALLLELADWK